MHYTSIRELLIEIHKIAVELGVSIENNKILGVLYQRKVTYSREIWDNLIKPLYFVPFFYGIKMDENNNLTAVRMEPDGEWIPYKSKKNSSGQM